MYVFVLEKRRKLTVRFLRTEERSVRLGTGLYASSLEPSVDSLDSLNDEGGVVGFLTIVVRSGGEHSLSIRTSMSKSNELIRSFKDFLRTNSEDLNVLELFLMYDFLLPIDD